MKAIIAILAGWCVGSACGQTPDNVYDAVRRCCMAHDTLLLTSSRSEFDSSYDIQPHDYQSALKNMDFEDQNLRKILREAKNDDQLASQVIRNLEQRKSMWDIQPVRIISIMLLLQKFDPDSIDKVCRTYEKVFKSYQEETLDEDSASKFKILKEEKFPCLFYTDGDLRQEQMTIVDYLIRLRKTAK